MSLLRYLYARIGQASWDRPSYNVIAIAPDFTSGVNNIDALLTLQFSPGVLSTSAAEDRISALGSLLPTVNLHGPRPFEAQMVNLDRQIYDEGSLTLFLGSRGLFASPWDFQSSFVLVAELLALEIQQDPSGPRRSPDRAMVYSLLSQALTTIRRSAPGNRFTSVTAGSNTPDPLVFEMSAVPTSIDVALNNSLAAKVLKAMHSTLGRYGPRTLTFVVFGSARPVGVVAKGSLRFRTSVGQTNSTEIDTAVTVA